MRAPRRCWSIAAGLLGCLVAGATHAQVIGYQLDRYEPAPAGDPFAVVEAPWLAARFAGAVIFDYAHDLLVAEQRDPTGTVVADATPIEHHQRAHVALAARVAERVVVSASVPIVLAEQGTAFAGVGPSGTTAGDPRIGARVRLWQAPDDTIAIGAAAYVWVPLGVTDQLAGDESPRGMLRLSAGGLARDRVRWAANAGLLARRTAQLVEDAGAGGVVGNELQLAAAASYPALAGRLSVGPEALASVALADRPATQGRAALEMFATARYALRDDLQLGLGVGGAAFGSGVPDARVLVSLTYALAPRRGSRFERVVVLPDEDGHVGAVEVDDGKHTTLLDRPYASTELRRGDRRARAVQSSRAAVERTAQDVVRALPPPDRDGDGIGDAVDSCPERAGSASADPIRNGCPVAAEKVVVLPDEDGHVGGVEIDDGHTRTVIDQPWGSAEVAADGTARVVPPAPPRAVQRSVAAVAGALPPPDADDDGILDGDDACPERAGVASPDPIRRGCPPATERVVVVPDPDGHVGGLEIDDGHTKVVVDRAYAAAEVAPDGTVRTVAPAPARSVDRAIAVVAGALPAGDGDGDGIRDELDACPDRAGIASPDPLRDGCPRASEKIVVLPDADGHVGAIEVDDGKTKLVLDAAYASSEVRDGRAERVAAAPVAVIARATSGVVGALPPADRDDDGIVDARDACPDRPGTPSPDDRRHGCPRTVEHVVVLPDEHGHVGAVEVDDGTTKTELATAYASAEVGTDGRLRPVPAEPSEVSARFADAMAARPPGARIILYFTVRSEPARDLTGPIDNLVAEVKTLATYKIEVIGHTDQTGSEATNLRIGRERAQLIADRLIAGGIPADRVEVKSKGSKEPAVRRQGRRQVELRNRRVEIWVR